MFLLQSNLVLMWERSFYSPTISVLSWTWELLTQGLFPPSPITAGKFYPVSKHKKGKCYNYFMGFQKPVFPRQEMSLLAVSSSDAVKAQKDVNRDVQYLRFSTDYTWNLALGVKALKGRCFTHFLDVANCLCSRFGAYRTRMSQPPNNTEIPSAVQS